MKLLLIVALLTGLGFDALDCCAQTPCHVEVKSTVEVTGPALRLVDVLSPDTCPEVRAAAAAVRIGEVPSQGSIRVIPGSEVDNSLQKILDRLPNRVEGSTVVRAPERIVVRQAGFHASCEEIEEELVTNHKSENAVTPDGTPTRAVTAQRKPDGIHCGASAGITPDASFELERKAWDPALRSWILFARCKNPRECVPFIVQVRDNSSPENPPNSRFPLRSSQFLATLRRDQIEFANGNLLVRRGQAAMLLWDQNGIRLTVPTVCLESGAPGKQIRTRIIPSGRVVRAIVVSAGMLRAIS
jgi:hypothetical protein